MAPRGLGVGVSQYTYDIAAVVLSCSGSFCTAHNMRTNCYWLASSQNSDMSDIVIRFSDPDFLKESNNSFRPWPFTLDLVIKVCAKFDRNPLICGKVIDAKIRTFAGVTSCCDLDLWPIDLERLLLIGCHVIIVHEFKL